MSRRPYRPGSLKFIVIAVFLMVCAEFFIFGGKRPYVEEARQEYNASQQKAAETPEPRPMEKIPAVTIFEKEDMRPQTAALREEKIPAWQAYAVPVDVPPGKIRITVIIDDLGADRARTRRVMGLPGPLTLAFLPYPDDVEALVEEGRRAGHEIMMHMPMEPMDAALDKGAYVLRPGMSAEDLEKVLLDNLSSFSGYVGINNHMGSRLTQDRAAMRLIMAHLREQGLLFVDSRTISASIAEEVAADLMVPHAARDVFLDNTPSPDAVNRQLAELERIAREKGHAIAIGHPKDATITALQEWLPALDEKGFVLVPVSAVVVTETRFPDRTTAAEGAD